MKMKVMKALVLPVCLILGSGAIDATQAANHRSTDRKLMSLPSTAIVRSSPGFRNQSELNAKYNQIKVGWTKAQVKQLLGEPQWGTANVWNYYINHKVDIKAINFRNGVVSSKGGKAG